MPAHTLIIGLSGPSSSGKTTLARLLRDIFNTSNDKISISLFIVHEDDFYKTDVDVPWREWSSTRYGKRKLQDWDCVESLDLPLLDRVLFHIKSHGTLPEDFASKEDQNSVGNTQVSQQELDRYSEIVKQWLSTISSTESTANHDADGRLEVRICVLEGFLLFPPPEEQLSSKDPAVREKFASTSSVQLAELATILQPVLDLKIFLPSTKELTISRRAARSGYVTLEGFWEDPPGYVDELVWPNYCRDQAWLFANDQDIDNGKADIAKAASQSILIGPGKGNEGMKIVLDWGFRTVQNKLSTILA